MDKTELVKLVKLRIREISGVESPANELDGFMVTKARNDTRKIIATADADAVFEAIEKAKHDARHPTTGRFQPAATDAPMVFPFEATGAVLPQIARAAAAASGKKHPGDTITPPGPIKTEGAYGDIGYPNHGHE